MVEAPKVPTFDQEWENYNLTVLDAGDADLTTRIRCRRAFYAGAWTFFRMENALIGGPYFEDTNIEEIDFDRMPDNEKQLRLDLMEDMIRHVRDTMLREAGG